MDDRLLMFKLNNGDEVGVEVEDAKQALADFKEGKVPYRGWIHVGDDDGWSQRHILRDAIVDVWISDRLQPLAAFGDNG